MIDRRVRRAAWLLLVLPSALALAGPHRHRHPTKPTKPVEPKPAEPSPDAGATAGSAAETQPATPSDTAAKPTANPAMPSATPAVAGAPASPATEAASSEDTDVDQLRQEYLSLRDELFRSRARANAVASQLYSTRVAIKLTWTSGRYYGVSKASIRLDGATVYEDATGAIAGDDGVRFDGYVAPGKHLVTFHVEAAGKDDDAFTETTESQVAVQAVANKDLAISARAHDTGDIAYAWKRSEHGSYGIGIDVGVKTVAREGAGKK